MMILSTLLTFLVILGLFGMIYRFWREKGLIGFIFALSLLTTSALGFMPAMTQSPPMTDILLMHLCFLVTFLILVAGLGVLKLKKD